jgi:hypothetical protein
MRPSCYMKKSQRWFGVSRVLDGFPNKFSVDVAKLHLPLARCGGVI